VDRSFEVAAVVAWSREVVDEQQSPGKEDEQFLLYA